MDPLVQQEGEQTRERPRFFAVAQAAAILGVDPVTLYRAIHADEFPAVKVRGRYVVPARALDEMEQEAITSGSLVNAADWTRTRGAAA